jgi:hypothetical protein
LLASIGANYPNASISFKEVWSYKKIGAMIKPLPIDKISIISRRVARKKRLAAENLYFLQKGGVVNLKITLKKEYSEIQSGRITQGFNFKIGLSFQVFISRVSRVLLLCFQEVFITLKKVFSLSTPL